MTTRHTLRIGVLLGLALPVGTAAAQEAPRQGGILKAAMIGEPPTLDTHTTTATIAYQIAWHVVETLHTYDRQVYATRDLKAFQASPNLHFWNAYVKP